MLPAAPMYGIPGQALPGRPVLPRRTHCRTQSQQSQASASSRSSVSTCGSAAEVQERAAPVVGKCRVRQCCRQMLKASSGKESKDPDAGVFRTWEVEILGADARLKPQGWNTQYAQAQQIFATPQGAQVRQQLRAEGRQLFKQAPVTAERVLGAPGLLETLLEATDQGTHVLVYALCIKQDRAVLRFCKARTLVAHAAMAEGRDSVWCSGELAVVAGAEPRVVLDNNSGTYAPPAGQLQKLVGLLAECFAGLPVEALHFEDPRLVELKQPLFGDPYSTFSGGLSQTKLGLKRGDQVEVLANGRWQPDSVQCISCTSKVLCRLGWVEADQVRRPQAPQRPAAVPLGGYARR